MLVIVTDQGEVFVYIGDYPGGAWNLSAKFAVGEPVAGAESVVQLGPDCILLGEGWVSADGPLPATRPVLQASAVAISRKIGNAVTEAVRAAKTEAGWQRAAVSARKHADFQFHSRAAGYSISSSSTP